MKALLCTALAGVGLCSSAPLLAQEASEAFTATLSTLNNSGVTGEAHVIRTDNQLAVIIVARGLEAGQPHAQHIHGLDDASQSATCPTLADDTDGDNVITLEEGLPAYGPDILALEPFPTPGGEVAVFAQTYTLGEGQTPAAAALSPLSNRAIVLHGVTFGGSYAATLPVACGELEPVFGIQNGAGQGAAG